LPALNVQVVAGLKVPVPLLVKLTVPVGVIGVPAADVSVTVAWHAVELFTTIVLCAQTIVVLDVLRLTVTFDAALVLAACVESPLYVPVTDAVPAADGVNVTEHDPLANVHEGELNVPAAPLEENETVPVGVLVGAGEVSVTVAVHVEPWFTTTGETHETAVLVDRNVTTTDAVALLVAWVPSPLYWAVIVSVLAVVPPAVYVTEHVAVVVFRVANVQGDVAKVPVPLVDHVTVPVGVVAPVEDVSLTVAVHVAALLIAIVDGVHDTVVIVGWSPPTETVPLPLLVAWTLSVGLYVPVTVAVPAVEPAVNVTEHVPEARVQLVGLTDDPVAVPVTTKLTVPAGVDDPAPLVSVTVATQLDVPRTVTEFGVQTTDVDVVLRVTVTVVVAFAGALWFVSPA